MTVAGNNERDELTKQFSELDGELKQALFFKDRSTLLRMQTSHGLQLALLDKDWRVVALQMEPSELQDAYLVSYTPTR